MRTAHVCVWFINVSCVNDNQSTHRDMKQFNMDEGVGWKTRQPHFQKHLHAGEREIRGREKQNSREKRKRKE